MKKGIQSNSYQGDFKRVLCVCSAGILRSATAAHVLCQEPYNFNTRNVGTAPYALIPLTEDLVQWADEIICMEAEHEIKVKLMLEDLMYIKPVITLDIEDIYEYRNPELIKLIQMKYNQYTVHHNGAAARDKELHVRSIHQGDAESSNN